MVSRVIGMFVGLLIASGAYASPDSLCTFKYDGIGESNHTVQIRKGERFTVCLPANPSTGYTWILPFRKSNGLDRLTLLNIQYRPGAAQTQGMTGVPGMSVYHFAAVQSGPVRFALEYQRPWEWQHEVKPVFIEIVIRPVR